MKKLTKAITALMLMTVFFAIGCNKPENQDDDVRVTTYTPQDVTQTSARCGGDVIVTQGLSLNEIGMCWSTSSKPTVEDAHLSTANWSEPYVCTITGLEPDTKYHVRAYALRGLEYYYGEDKSFTTEGNSGGGGGGGGGDDHAYVDLGLPSGLLWATCNVGADNPEDYGDYFAWGETQPKDTYDWSTYQFSYGSSSMLTKYCNNSSYGCNGFIDNLTILQSGDDAATANWGSGARMPTKQEWEELKYYCSSVWTTQNGVNGRRFTGQNGSTLFLPATGCCRNDEFNWVGVIGHYWSSSLGTDGPNKAWIFDFLSGYTSMDDYGRDHGLSVRPVRSARQS